VQQRHSGTVQAVVQGSKKRIVLAAPDMFEHANGHHPVIALGNGAARTMRFLLPWTTAWTVPEWRCCTRSGAVAARP
jgi:hypothetical protein